MLRSSLPRPLLLRQFSTTSRWTSARPPAHHDPTTPTEAPEDVSSIPPPAGTHVLDATPPHVSSSSTSTSASKPSTSTRQDSAKSQDPLSSYDLKLVKQRIRNWMDQATVTFRNRADDFTASTKTTFSQLGAELNKVTGYEEIDALKRDVANQESRIQATREAARQAKTAYEQAVIQRSNSQREVNELLQRKSLWTDGDVGRFTTLVRQDHLYEQEEARAKATVEETDDAVEREFSQLMRSILARYHEEQVWSDKIRSASTYGSLAALGLNMFVFVMAIVIVEPWKRRRLAQTFETKIEELSTENAVRLDVTMQDIGKRLDEQEEVMVKFLKDVSQKLNRIPEPIPLLDQEEVKIPAKVVAEPNLVPIISPRREVELAVIGAGAFLVGVVGCLTLGR